MYLDAARVLAHLASTPDVNREDNIERFWELYWGELPFVESAEIRKKMVAFCVKNFDKGLCGQEMNAKTPINDKVAAAIDLSQAASCQIRSRWSVPQKVTVDILGKTYGMMVVCPPDNISPSH